ncbi:hypothetical protein ACFE04_002366 [Oxalis oulophora]
MKLRSRNLALCSLLFVFLLHSVTPSLYSDKQALLRFANSVPHGRKLNWFSSRPVCTSWVGITCNTNRSNVVSLRLPGIGLRGPIPANTLGKLTALMILSLRSNQLNGTLPSDLVSLSSLQYLYLQHNNFTGDIPPSLSPRLNYLDLSFNSFAGNIPETIENLTNLIGLDLQNNSLTGSIPDLVLPELQNLNLSYNKLNGSIPSRLRKFPESSFEGNSLCGPPLNQCSALTTLSPSPSPSPSPSSTLLPSPFPSPSPSPFLTPVLQTLPPEVARSDSKKKSVSTGARIGIAVGCVAAFFFITFIAIFLCCLKKKRRNRTIVAKGKSGRGEKPSEEFGSGVQGAEKNKLVFFEGCSFSFDLEDLLRASAEVLGKGSCGTTYKAILDEGTTVVVKRLKEIVIGKREFEQQMEVIGKVTQHPNVMPLRAYYYCKEEKLLVYDYISAGSFSSTLHGIGQTPLDWESRVRICLGAAKGLAHIHSVGGGKFVHGNIKSSNVLLPEGRNGCILDFGLTPLITNYPTVSPRSVGYHAPEVIETKRTTQKSDVYSFGVLLLEMLTGKAPTGHDDMVDLPKWVQSVVREEWTAEVFDVELMSYHNIEEEMVQMLQLAMVCVTKIPNVRPTMEEVVRTIEEIHPSDPENTPSPEDNKSKDSNDQTP